MVKTYVFDDDGEEFIDSEGLKEVVGLKDFKLDQVSIKSASGPCRPINVEGKLYWPYIQVRKVVQSLGLVPGDD